MKSHSLLAILLCLFFGCSCDSTREFKISETVKKFDFRKVEDDLRQQRDSIFFEDQFYRVRSSCSGEWGGSIWFTNKKSGIEYSCEAICPVVVNKFDNKYIVTAALAHGMGFSQIIEISNPNSMEVFQLPELKQQEDGTLVRYVGDDESRSIKGIQSLADSTGILAISSFPYQNEIYHIVTDFKKTYVSKIIDGKFQVIDKVSDKSIWTYNPEVIVTANGHYVTFFRNEKARGYIDIHNNLIELNLLE